MAQTIPRIDGRNGECEIRHFLLGEMLPHLAIDMVWYPTLCDAGHGFGPGQRCPLALGVERALLPCIQFVQALVLLADRLQIFPVHVETVRTPVEL